MKKGEMGIFEKNEIWGYEVRKICDFRTLWDDSELLLLITDYWLLITITNYWLLITDYWLLITDYWLTRGCSSVG